MNIVNVSVSSAAISPAHGVLKSVQTQSGGNGFFYQKTSEKQPEKNKPGPIEIWNNICQTEKLVP